MLFARQCYLHVNVNTKGYFDRTETKTNPMHFKWEVTQMHGNQSNTF